MANLKNRLSVSHAQAGRTARDPDAGSLYRSSASMLRRQAEVAVGRCAEIGEARRRFLVAHVVHRPHRYGCLVSGFLLADPAGDNSELSRTTGYGVDHILLSRPRRSSRGFHA